MKRWTLRISICLVLGAVTTVAVAWGIAWLGRVEHAWRFLDTPDRRWHASGWYDRDGGKGFVVWVHRSAGRHWVVFAWDTMSHDRFTRGAKWPNWPKPTLNESEFLIPEWTTASEFRHGVYDIEDYWGWFDVAYGWPVQSLRCRYMWYSGPGYLKVLDGWEVGDPKQEPFGSQPLIVPLRVMVAGFATNTILYAAMLWMLFYCVGTVRRWNRKRRWLCPHCAYDLRGNSSGHSGCPECGWNRDNQSG